MPVKLAGAAAKLARGTMRESQRIPQGLRTAHNGLMTPVFDKSCHSERHRQQIHGKMPSNPAPNRKLAVSDGASSAEQRAHPDRLANEVGSRRKANVLVEVKGLDINCPANPPGGHAMVQAGEAYQEDAVADEMQDLHP